jgi:hypothetical protein
MSEDTLKNDQEIFVYKDILESFFSKNYPSLEKGKFWKWFILTLTGKEKDINELNPEELQAFLGKLKELGDVLYDPKYFMSAMN